MPCTPTMPLPATVTIACPAHDRERLDRIARQRSARGDFGARRSGIEERSHVQHDAGARDRDERARDGVTFAP